MNFLRHKTLLFSLLLLPSLLVPFAHAERFQVLTRSYGNERTNANLSEKTLTPARLKSGHFGKLFMLPVDDEIFAGLLYAADLTIGGHKHNVLYVATVNNSVYAFDADKAGAPLWQRNFNGPGRPTRYTEVGQACRIYRDFVGNIGIIGTPVISPDQTMYFVTRTVEYGTTTQRLHALDILTGDERPHSPQTIEATVPGKGDGAVAGEVAFNPVTENQRPALAYANGTVYVGWASFCDTRPYHGWMMAYDAKSLAQVSIFNTSPNGNMAGIWMSGAGPTFDSSGNLIVTTGNGTYDGVTEFGESMIKLEPRTLRVRDYFVPSNFNTLNDFDLDFGTQGPTLLPGTGLMVVGGKEGKLYVVDVANMGKHVPGDIQIAQEVQVIDPTVRPTLSHHMHNSNPAWKSARGWNVYTWGESDFPRAFRLDAAKRQFVTPDIAVGNILAPPGMPGGMMTISANGSRNGILWATLPRNGDANHSAVPGFLYAFDAENLRLLWSSAGVNDEAFSFAKGSPPVVVNGKVYVASLAGFVSVYGLRKGTPNFQNLALKAQATGSAPCSESQSPEKAFNGSALTGLADKWCSSAADPFLQADLGRKLAVGRVVLEHAGAGGEDFHLNTRSFNLQVSDDGRNFTTVETVRDNDKSITFHDFAPVEARYVRLNITAPAQDDSRTANIYEMQVYPPVPTMDAASALDEIEDLPPASTAPAAVADDPPGVKEPETKTKTEVTRTGRVITAPSDVAAPGSDAQVTEDGLGMKVLKQGTGSEHPLSNDCVTVSFIAWKRDGTLFSTSTSMNDSDLLCMNEAVVGVREALSQMVVGERRRVWVPEDMTFRGRPHHIQHRPEDEEPPRKDLTFDLKLLSILKAPPAPADLKQAPSTATRLPSGLAYQVLQNGTGAAHPGNTNKITMQFACWRGDGHLYESTYIRKHPVELTVATALPGVREAVSQMVVGEKARFWIPAALAYGEKPVEGFYPAGDLVYEIELVGIE
ncbi:MAG: FKBP-type peptidyl-prolyl cis-trans isomerase [Acidobacteria bacterium]|nr:FKBP-type peptidyl-prolyl cis-trans isomerase [Acidobacteriota bacterium]